MIFHWVLVGVDYFLRAYDARFLVRLKRYGFFIVFNLCSASSVRISYSIKYIDSMFFK